MGNDEHSQNVYKSALEQGLDPLAYCDRMEEMFQKTWRALDLSYDYFIRTTEPRHKSGVTELVQRIYDAGDIYEGVYEGWYCVGCEAFKPEKGTRRRALSAASADRAAMDQGEELLFPAFEVPEAAAGSFQDQSGLFEPEARRNEQLRLLESGLDDISISRAGQSWGIPLPWDPEQRCLCLVRRAD